MAAQRPRRGHAAAAESPCVPAAAPAGASASGARQSAPAAAAAAGASPSPLPPLRRRKVLYERREREEDDATDASFLEELVLNLDVRPRSYRQVMRDSVAIAQQLSVAVATAALFFFASDGTLQPEALLGVDGARLLCRAAPCVAPRLRRRAHAAAPAPQWR